MSHRLRLAVATGLLTLVGLAGVGGVGASPARAAGPCETATTAQHATAARAVFSGTVQSSERLTAGTGRAVVFAAEIGVDRVYKGGISSEVVEVRTERAPGECGLGRLTEGTRYLFFADLASGVWAAGGSSGTAPIDDKLQAQVVRLLGEGRSAVPPPPLQAEFTPLSDDEPAPFSRVVAPGAALVLIGLLGLVVVRRLQR